MLHLHLRTAVPADVPRLIEIRGAVIENRLSDPASIGPEDYLPYIHRGHCWVAEQGGRIAGFAALDAKAASVWALFVDPGSESRGAGSALLVRLTAEARRLNLPRLHLLTSPGTRAEGFYRRSGWTIAGRNARGELEMRLDL